MRRRDKAQSVVGGMDGASRASQYGGEMRGEFGLVRFGFLPQQVLFGSGITYGQPHSATLFPQYTIVFDRERRRDLADITESILAERL